MVLYLNGALPVRVTRGALVVHRYTYVPPCCRTSQYPRTFVLISVSLWNDLADPYSMMGNWLVSRAEPMLFYFQEPYYCLLLFSLSFLSVYRLNWYCRDGVFGLLGCISLSLSLALPTSLNNNNNNNSKRHDRDTSVMTGHVGPDRGVLCRGHTVLSCTKR